jgi:hypothetical protein
MWLDPTDVMARFAGPNAVNKAGETLIDLVALLVKADRIGCGDDPLRAVEDVLERLTTLERREDERSDNRASPPKKKTETSAPPD